MKIRDLPPGAKFHLPNSGNCIYIGNGSGREKHYQIIEQNNKRMTICYDGEVKQLK